LERPAEQLECYFELPGASATILCGAGAFRTGCDREPGDNTESQGQWLGCFKLRLRRGGSSTFIITYSKPRSNTVWMQWPFQRGALTCARRSRPPLQRIMKNGFPYLVSAGGRGLSGANIDPDAWCVTMPTTVRY
jgi:hypothetical protein